MISIGVDWGTHSSKWWVVRSEGGVDIIVGPILDSHVDRVGEQIVFSLGGETAPSPYSLKRAIIRDPMGSFWDGIRGDTYTSLGEAVCFSLCSILGDVATEAKKRGIDISKDGDIKFGFSFPNWLGENDEGARAATRHFHQAVNVSIWLLQETFHDGFPRARELYQIDQWRKLVNDARGSMTLDETVIDTGQLTSTFYKLHGLKDTRWSYLVESCAAGLPYLRAINIEEIAPPDLPWLVKLLVIDVGAGSTDVGYMIRTKDRDSGEELLNYFAPAPALEVAGNSLTNKIKEFYNSKGRLMTFAESERIKVNPDLSKEWRELPFLDHWRQEIGHHIEQYVKDIPDTKRLTDPRQLQIVLTGGSAGEHGLKDEVYRAVKDAFKGRGFVTNMEIIDPDLLGFDFKDENESARRAVSIGAADKDKPSLKYLKRL